MLDDLFEADNAAAARDLIARPLPPPPKAAKFSAWSAIPRGAFTGMLAEPAASLSDIAGAIATFRDTPSKQMERGGLPTAAFSSELGDSVRDYWSALKPDPQTASTAEQVLFGFSRGLAKLLPATIAAGPAGAIGVGIEEAMTVSDELRRQGVQDGPRQLAGLIQGTGMASAALPLLGRTLAETAALYVAGGPGGFMAQQALTRKVLENAGQEKIAGNYDPFDPVGLTIASVIPLAFTAAGLRAQKLRAEAKAQADFIAGPRPSEPTPVAAAVAEAVRAPEFSPEVVDAAMVNHLRVADDFMTVWHGSPHKFDAFDSSKIGTGEGAQAYGHGLYLAESRGVAESYSKLNPVSSVRVVKAEAGYDVLGVRDAGELDELGSFKTRAEADAAAMAYRESAANIYRISIPRSMTERMLDWDKPLKDQPEALASLGAMIDQTALGNAIGVYKGKIPLAPLGGTMPGGGVYPTGADLYRRMHEAAISLGRAEPAAIKERQAVEAMRQAGIPGIRYLDGGSRATGEGTYNYVIFPGEEGKLRILEANGKPSAAPEPAAPAPPHTGPEPWDMPQATERALPEPAAIADDLRSLGRGAGWAQEGGSIIRNTPREVGIGEGPIHMHGEVIGRTKWIPFEAWYAQMRSELGKGGLSKPQAIQDAIEKAIEGKPLKAAERRTVDWLRAEVQRMDDSLLTVLDDAPEVGRDARALGLGSADTADIALTARAAEIDAQAMESAAIRFEEDDAAFMAEVRRIVGDEEATRIEAAATADNARAGARAGGAEAPAAQGKEGDALAKLNEPADAPPKPLAPPIQDTLAARVAELDPELVVRVDPDGRHVTLADDLAEVRRITAEGTDDALGTLDADLLQVAVNCALSSGG